MAEFESERAFVMELHRRFPGDLKRISPGDTVGERRLLDWAKGLVSVHVVSHGDLSPGEAVVCLGEGSVYYRLVGAYVGPDPDNERRAVVRYRHDHPERDEYASVALKWLARPERSALVGGVQWPKS